MNLLLNFFGLLGRRYPFKRGTNFFAHHTPLKKICETGPFKAKLRSGVKLKIDPKDYNGRVVALFGLQEPNITAICIKNLHKSDIFLDIGANNGAVGLNCIHAASEIHFFEPQPELGENIRECIETHNLAHLTLHPIGLLDKDAEIDLHISKNHSGTGSFIHNHAGTVINVPVKKAATYLEPILKGHTFGAKIDVEGAEKEVISEILNLPGMRFLVFEHQGKGEIWDLLKGKNLFGIDTKWVLPSYSKIASRQDMANFEDFIVFNEI